MPTIRTFVALPIPDDVRGAIAALRGAATPDAPVRWVAADSIHLTLKFLGEVEAERVDAVRAALTSFPWNPLPCAFTLCGVGAFPNLVRPRILWVGVTDGADRLVALADQVERALGPLGFSREERPFSPHLTIGRFKAPGRAGWAEAFAATAAFGPAEVRASELRLYESQLLPSGARHTLLLAVALGA